MSNTTRSIGQVLDLLAEEFSDISISKIRFLESQGLIDPERSQSGYRKFTETDVKQLRWILEQQRDHFLPLKVIKERIDAGSSNGAKDHEQAQPKAVDANVQSSQDLNLFPSQKNQELLTAAELAFKSGLNVAQIAELEKFGLIELIADGTRSHYNAEAETVAKAAAGFLAHGIEPRHLRAYKAAVEREAGLLEQRIMPLVMQRTSAAQRKTHAVLSDLVDLGSELRMSLLRMALGSHMSSR